MTNKKCYYCLSKHLYNYGGSIEKGYPPYPVEYAARCEKYAVFFTQVYDKKINPSCEDCQYKEEAK